MLKHPKLPAFQSLLRSVTEIPGVICVMWRDLFFVRPLSGGRNVRAWSLLVLWSVWLLSPTSQTFSPASALWAWGPNTMGSLALCRQAGWFGEGAESSPTKSIDGEGAAAFGRPGALAGDDGGNRRAGESVVLDIQQDPVESTAVSSPWDVLKQDPRLQEPRSLDSFFPFAVPPSLADWEDQKRGMRRRLLTLLGLHPELPKPKLAPVIGPPRVMDGYTVSSVYFESLPGFYVTGSLYRPLDETNSASVEGDSSGSSVPPDASVTKRPGILCPHGHWGGGRFMYASDDEVQRQLASGGETLECGARSPLQARCVHLARMGCVVFHYDMLGNADSIQIPASIAHGFAKQRPDMNEPSGWGLFSVRAESHFQSVMGLQTWNSIRSLDFLESLEDVDEFRLGVTGASGGGTQTFILGAIDPRPALVFPAVMVGTSMQGGCVCENCSFLRIEQGNVAFAAMFAPKPQGLTAADDWTREMENVGFPELKALYSLYGAEDQVELTSRLEFGHNYNQVGRQAMYRLVARNFGLKDFPERPFEVLREKDLTCRRPVIADDSPGDPNASAESEAAVTVDSIPSDFTPETGPDFEKKLLREWQLQTRAGWQQWLAASLLDKQRSGTDSQWNDWRKTFRDLYIGPDFTFPESPTWVLVAQEKFGNWQRTDWLLRHDETGVQLPVITWSQTQLPTESPLGGKNVRIYLGDAADDLVDTDGQVVDWGRKYLEVGEIILSLDLLGQGRFVDHGNFKMDDRWKMTQREAAGYVVGYNYPLISERSRDVWLAIVASRFAADLNIVAKGDGIPVVSLAMLLHDDWRATHSKSPEFSVELLDGDFRFVDVPSIRDVNFLPGAAVAGDLPGLWLFNRVPNVRVFASDSDWENVNQWREKLHGLALQFNTTSEQP